MPSAQMPCSPLGVKSFHSLSITETEVSTSKQASLSSSMKLSYEACRSLKLGVSKAEKLIKGRGKHVKNIQHIQIPIARSIIPKSIRIGPYFSDYGPFEIDLNKNLAKNVYIFYVISAILFIVFVFG